MRIVGFVLLLVINVSLFGQTFHGEISGKLTETSYTSDFTWEFGEDTTFYFLAFELEEELHEVKMTFTNSGTAQVEIVEGGNLVESRTLTPEEVRKDIVVVERNYSNGPEYMSYTTEKAQFRTDDKEIESLLAEIDVDWNGADHFFVGDIPFALSNEKEGMFPLKIMSTDLKGNLEYSFEVTTIEAK